MIITPEVRQQTDRFFRRPVAQLDEALQGMAVRVHGTDLVVRIDQTKPWDQVGPNYIRQNSPVNMRTLNLGEAWAFRIPRFFMNQFLIKAQGEEGHDACVQVLKGSRLNKATSSLEPMKNQGDVANALQMENNAVEQLWVLDPERPMLYIVRNHLAVTDRIETPLEGPTPAEGEAYLRRMIGE